MSEIFISIPVSLHSIDKKTYDCGDCNLEFTSEQSLKKHVIQTHYEFETAIDKETKIVYRFSCPVETCRRSLQMEGEYFPTRKLLVQHYMKVHESKRFSCEQCHKMFATESLRNIHSRNCGKLTKCNVCHLHFNSREAMLTHARRKHRNNNIVEDDNATTVKRQKTMMTQTAIETREIAALSQTKEVATTTSGLGLWNSSENLAAVALSDAVKTSSVFTSTENLNSTSRSAGTSPLRITKDSSTSIDDEPRDSTEITAKKISSWNGDFDDAMNLFDSDSKLEFFSTETQTDFTENLFHNNYTQTTFNDLYDFVKFDNQTQTNWNDL